MHTDQQSSDSGFAALRAHRFLRLTTFRRSGTPVGSAVWFAVDPSDGSVYVMTPEGTGKLKRIRLNPNVELAASNARGVAAGPALHGIIEVVHDPTLRQRIDAALRTRYGLFRRVVHLVMRLRGKRWVYLRIRSAAAEGTPG